MEKGLPWMAGGYPGAIGVSESRALRRAERDEWSVDIQEEQRRLRRTCHDRTIALPSFPNRRRRGSGSRSVTAPHQVHQTPIHGRKSSALFGGARLDAEWSVVGFDLDHARVSTTKQGLDRPTDDHVVIRSISGQSRCVAGLRPLR